MKIRRPLASLLRGVPGAAAVWLRGGGWRWPRRGRSRCWPPVPAGFRRRPSVGGGSPHRGSGCRQRRPVSVAGGASAARRTGAGDAAVRRRQPPPDGGGAPAPRRCPPAARRGRWGRGEPVPRALAPWGGALCRAAAGGAERRPLPSLLRAPGAARRGAPRREAPARRLSSGGCQRRQAQGAWGLARVRCGARVTGAAAPSNPCLPAAAVPRRRSAGLAYAQALRPDAARSTLA